MWGWASGQSPSIHRQRIQISSYKEKKNGFGPLLIFKKTYAYRFRSVDVKTILGPCIMYNE